MPANKRLTDLTDYVSILPYASELFGVYQPLIGWKSKRRRKKIGAGMRPELDRILKLYQGIYDPGFNADHVMEPGGIEIGRPRGVIIRPANGSLLLAELAAVLQEAGSAPVGDEWHHYLDPQRMVDLLNGPVYGAIREEYNNRYIGAGLSGAALDQLKAETVGRLNHESVMAGLLLNLLERSLYGQLASLFLVSGNAEMELYNVLPSLISDFDDPFLTFDPNKDVRNVTLSPIGVVHLFRQYFFELDSFLGTPVGHVWLTPGSTVELVEVSTRRTMVEKIIETSLETTTKTEKSTTDEEEISEAIKQDNKQDVKLGFSTTVNQSWGTGNATATGTLNLDNTQTTAREQQHRRSRQQTEKLSTEIRQNFKSTFKTVTETIDTSSKRYVLNNVTPDLINYELRRKMRQVGVQIQDVGTYLCWESFVDEPGRALSLANLIHIAKPADLVIVPNPKLMPMPPLSIQLGFTGEAVWNFPDNARQNNSQHPEVNGQFVPLATLDVPGIPPEYEVAFDPANPFIAVEKQVVAASDDESWGAANWGFRGMITPDGKRVMVGVVTGPGGLAWDDRITFKVSGGVTCRLKQSKQDEITATNTALISAKLAADAENSRNLEKAIIDSVKERVTLASTIEKRKFEDLREEERTIVYRRLIKALMAEQYHDLPETPSGFESRHVLSELINAIFDVDKMLYFVAPEWWKPRAVLSQLNIGGAAIPSSIAGSTITWANDQAYEKYYITDTSEPAPLGSSLGWLLQLDGDDLRNAFLNAPWVKAVIPIRPGKEEAAINWLKNVRVEGADGLDAAYAAPEVELDAIRANLLAHHPDDPVAEHEQVTIDDAIRNLCITVADKHALSNTVGRYPEDEIHDENRVSATPIERVYEHGFYPLKGGFKAKTEEPFEVCSQWVEVLPTDQVVPVPVKYDPRTGRQLPP